MNYTVGERVVFSDDVIVKKGRPRGSAVADAVRHADLVARMQHDSDLRETARAARRLETAATWWAIRMELAECRNQLETLL